MNTAIMQDRKKNQTKGTYSSKTRQVKADIIFGMPSKDCNNFGVCKISRSNNVPSSALDTSCTECMANKACATLLLTDTNELEIHFAKTEISEDTQKKHFANNTFHVMESYNCNEDICKALQIDYLEIREGEYQVLRSETHFIIKF